VYVLLAAKYATVVCANRDKLTVVGYSISDVSILHNNNNNKTQTYTLLISKPLGMKYQWAKNNNNPD